MSIDVEGAELKELGANGLLVCVNGRITASYNHVVFLKLVRQEGIISTRPNKSGILPVDLAGAVIEPADLSNQLQQFLAGITCFTLIANWWAFILPGSPILGALWLGSKKSTLRSTWRIWHMPTLRAWKESRSEFRKDHMTSSRTHQWPSNYTNIGLNIRKNLSQDRLSEICKK